MARIPVTPDISIGEDELDERFIRSSGPGGQNVNALATAVQLRFSVRTSPSLPERVRAKILESGDSRLTAEGELVIAASRHRTQEANRRDARSRLVEIIRKASVFPKRRVPTRPSRAARQRRLDGKRHRGALKRTRSTRRDAE
ncbi:MAG: alternative ribosome rescue aminoacyl-tRNA hydrolase ArfB [Pseudomonadota bacterium]